MVVPLGYMPLNEAARLASAASIFDAFREFELHFFSWGNDDIVMMTPDIIEPRENVRFLPDRSAETGRLEFERLRPSPFLSFVCRGHGWLVFVDREEFEGWLRPKVRHAGGRPAKYDWDAFKEAFLDRVAKMGLPGNDNVDEWRTQADVERWIKEVATRGGNDEPSDTQARKHARAFIDHARRMVGN